MAPPTNLEKYKTELKNDKMILSVIETTVKAHTTTPLDAADVVFYTTEITQLWNNIKDIFNKIQLAETDPDLVATQASEHADTFRLVSTLKSTLARITPIVPTPPPTSVAAKSSVKLPEIKLPTFSGDANEWLTFRDMFLSTIHNDSRLGDTQKFSYLQSSLAGEAKNLIKSFSITDANYAIAWDIVKKRYENERELYFNILRKFCAIPSANEQNPSTLRALVDSTNECSRALENLALTDKWDAMQMFLVCQKLDPVSRQFWELSLQGTSVPACKDLLAFVEQRARSLSAGGVGPKTKTQMQNPNHEGSRKPHAFHAAPRNDSTRQGKCKICSDNHLHFQCPKLIAMPVEARREAVKTKGLCFNCLKPNHNAVNCSSEKSCSQCQSRHHSLLHLIRDGSSAKPSPSTSNVTNFHIQGNEKQTILATAQIRVLDKHGEPHLFKAMLDGGSTASFVSESCITALGLTRQKSNAEIVGLASSNLGKTKGITTVRFKPHFESKFNSMFSIEAYILAKVTSELPLSKLENANWSHLNGIQLADPTYAIPMQIDLILGADVFYNLLLNGKKTGGAGTPLALNSKLGWIVGGPTENPAQQLHVNHANLHLEECLQRFWEVEEMPKVKHYSAEEKACEEHFLKTHSRDPSGRYVVHIPMKSPQVPLGSSREMAVRRLMQVERRLKSKPKVQDLYVDFMRKYVELGHMVKIPREEKSMRNFLPHHFVLKDMDMLNKFRVVFDGSAKTSSGFSFNDTQLVGPTVQESLVTQLMRFRVHAIAIVADVAKMYRQVLVTPSQQELQCIVWRESPLHPVEDYKLLTVTYGTASGPYLATRALQQLALDEEAKFPIAAKIVKNDFYVDDCMTGAADEESAIETIRQLRGITASGQLSLRKFASNCPQVLKHVPDEMRETKATLSMEEEDEVVTTLGLHWNTASDEFLFKVKMEEPAGVLTKRCLLSEISKIFDPMGWLAPTIILTKILMQDVWKEKTTWDEPPPIHIQNRWQSFKLNLKKLEEVRIPRCLSLSNAKYELHGFSDASEKAYGAVIYVRAIPPEGEITVSLITAKSKVAPVKTVSIPRLELCGSLLLAELMEAVQDDLPCRFENVNAWTDSTVVLAWLGYCPSKLKTFCANRVSKIQEILPRSQWRHVPGIENPADCASRGVLPEDLSTHPLWWTGPAWLSQRDQLPNSIPVPDPSHEENVRAEEKTLVLVARTTVVDYSLLSNYPSLLKLKRVTAWLFRFCNNALVNFRAKKMSFISSRRSGPLSVRELDDAEYAWVKIVQESSFSPEVRSLSEGKQIPTSSKILALAPFLDKNGILRVGGRLRHAKIPEPRKNPVLLPRHNRLTELVIQHYHMQTYHGGPQHVQSILAQKFWIIRSRDAISHQIRKCVPCTRQRAKTMTQQMGDLPEARVVPCRAFLKTGVDYAGPFLLRAIPGRSKVTFKAYIALFICYVTRAMHLELVSSLSTDAFIAALRRFTARRGRPTDMHSDCGTNFVGAAKELKELHLLIKSAAHNETIANKLSAEGIQWHFNPAGAPHFGGLWEAGVKSVKRHLYTVVGQSRLTFEEMSTILTQIEGSLNSRPLTPLSNDPMDLTALTPAHFLVGEPMDDIPDPDLSCIPENRLSRWQLCQQKRQHYLKRWSQEVLTRLQQRPKNWMIKKTNIQINDLVLVKTEGVHSNHWPLARVLFIHPGKDENVRAVTLRTANGEIQRPIAKLCLLPLDNGKTNTTC